MKILFVLNSIYCKGNGLATSARRTVLYLRKTGNEVRVLSGPNSDEEDGPQPDYCLESYHFPIFDPLIRSHGYFFAKSDLALIEEAVKWADVVHLDEPFVLQKKTARICEKLGVPCTGTYHLHPENIFCSIHMGGWRWINKTLLRIWRDKVFDHCTHIQCPSENVHDRLIRYDFKARLHTISNGVISEPCIRPLTPPDDYESPDRPLKVVYIGRLAVEKDQPTLLEAMRHSAYAKRIQLVFAGKGPEAKKLKKKAERLYKDGVVSYEPEFCFCSHHELRQLAASADLCIHCATIEVEGLSIMEAIQQGAVPIIAAGRYTGTSQFALDRRSVFPEKNPEALAHRIDYWLSHPKERWEMGQKYVSSMERYKIENSVDMLLDMFQQAIDQNKQA